MLKYLSYSSPKLDNWTNLIHNYSMLPTCIQVLGRPYEKETYQIDRLRVVDDVDGLDCEWLEAWAEAAEAEDAFIPFEALQDLERKNIPMLDLRDTL